jgi:hypothetical protein
MSYIKQTLAYAGVCFCNTYPAEAGLYKNRTGGALYIQVGFMNIR